MNIEGLKVLRIDVLKVELGKRKLCECENPQYTIDVENRLVYCDTCGAIVEPYEALVKLANKYQGIADKQAQLIKYISTLSADCETLRTKKQQLTVFKDMAAQYRRGMLPLCPHCDEPIYPTRVTGYINRKFYELRKSTQEVDGE